jgi:fluoride exporter
VQPALGFLLNLGAVAAGGAIGASLRFLTSAALHRVLLVYPGAATLLVNVVGSLLIGLVLGGLPPAWLSDRVRMFLVTGILGGLTTFSSLAYETVSMSQTHSERWLGAAHLIANIVLGLAAVLLGELLARTWRSVIA